MPAAGDADEARRDDLALGVDDLGALGQLEVVADRVDLVVGDQHGGAGQALAGAEVDVAADDRGVLFGLSSGFSATAGGWRGRRRLGRCGRRGGRGPGPEDR